MGTKERPGLYDCLDKCAPDEPFFVLRAKDPIAAELVELWAIRARTIHENDKVLEAQACSEAMVKWRSDKFGNGQ